MTQNLLPSRKNNGKGTPPPVVVAPAGHDNLSRVEPNAAKQLSLLVPQAKKMEMITYAKERGLTVTKILIRAFDDYKSRNQ